MPVTPKEFDKTVTISLGALVFVACIAFSLGKLFTRNEAMQENQRVQYEELRQYVEQEVGGLRSDWERARANDRKLMEDGFEECKEDFLYLRNKHD